MRITNRRHAYTYGDYLLTEEESPTVRHEFIDGEIVAMAGGSRLHSALIAAAGGELYVQLRDKPCGVHESNMRVRVEETGNAFYPDALVVCGRAEIIREAHGGDSLLNPRAIIEVLSPSTEDYDRGAKFDDEYSAIPSLQAYVLIAQDQELIEVRLRDQAGQWTTREYRSGERAEVTPIGCALDVDTLYREARKNLPPESEA